MPRQPTLRRSNGYWYTQAGCRDGVYFGRIDEVPYQVARTRFGEYLATLNRGAPTPIGLPQRSAAEVCSRHLDWVLKNRSKSLFSQRKSLLNGFCNFRVGEYEGNRLPGTGLLVGELRAASIVRKHIEAYLDHLRVEPSKKTGKPVGDKALRHVVIALKATWNWAADPIEDGGGEMLPADHRPLRKLPRGFVQPKDLTEIDLPTDAEIDSLWRWGSIEPSQLPDDGCPWSNSLKASCSSEESLAFVTLLRAYHATGARTSELCDAVVGDFMPRTRQVCLGKHKRSRTQQNATIRNIQLDGDLASTLGQAVRGKSSNDPLFSHADGRSWNQNEVNSRLRRVRAVATAHDELIRDHITPYSFRDLYISELLMVGIEPFKVAKMAGTSLKEIDRTYGHFFNRDLVDAQEKLSAARRLRNT